jgi:hypothetical protein
LVTCAKAGTRVQESKQPTKPRVAMLDSARTCSIRTHKPRSVANDARRFECRVMLSAFGDRCGTQRHGAGFPASVDRELRGQRHQHVDGRPDSCPDKASSSDGTKTFFIRAAWIERPMDVRLAAHAEMSEFRHPVTAKEHAAARSLPGATHMNLCFGRFAAISSGCALERPGSLSVCVRERNVLETGRRRVRRATDRDGRGLLHTIPASPVETNVRLHRWPHRSGEALRERS